MINVNTQGGLFDPLLISSLSDILAWYLQNDCDFHTYTILCLRKTLGGILEEYFGDFLFYRLMFSQLITENVKTRQSSNRPMLTLTALQYVDFDRPPICWLWPSSNMLTLTALQYVNFDRSPICWLWPFSNMLTLTVLQYVNFDRPPICWLWPPSNMLTLTALQYVDFGRPPACPRINAIRLVLSLDRVDCYIVINPSFKTIIWRHKQRTFILEHSKTSIRQRLNLLQASRTSSSADVWRSILENPVLGLQLSGMRQL